MRPPRKITRHADIQRAVRAVANDIDPPSIHGGDALLRPRLELLRIVEGKAHDHGRDALLMAVELAHLDLGTGRGIGNIHSAKGDVLFQDRGTRAAGDGPYLGAVDMHAVALPRRLVAVELEPDKLPARVFLAAKYRLAADEFLVALHRDSKSDARLIRIDLIGELIPGEDKSRLDAQHVEGFETERQQAVGLAGFPDRVPNGGGILGMTEDLVAQLTGVAGA